MTEVSRRALLGGAMVSRLLAARPKGYLVETAIHLFAQDQKRFPYHPNATYRPAPLPLESYAAFVRESKLDHTVTRPHARSRPQASGPHCRLPPARCATAICAPRE